MSGVGQNRRMFIDEKIQEAFGKRNMDVEQMIEDLASEDRSTSVF